MQGARAEHRKPQRSQHPYLPRPLPRALLPPLRVPVCQQPPAPPAIQLGVDAGTEGRGREESWGSAARGVGGIGGRCEAG
eukprot:3425829-Rhodomonas_salina.1